MKRIRKITALLLCVLMMLPTQGIVTLADGMTNKQEAIPPDDNTDEIERSDEILPLDLLNESGGKSGVDDSEPIIYWNPGTSMTAELMTGSNDRKAAGSNAKAKAGSDQADGKSPTTSVKTLKAALERAEKLQEELGISPSDITIYAMNPMEVGDGQLTLVNAILGSGEPSDDPELIYMKGGVLHMGRKVTVNGRVVMDYESQEEENPWDLATDSDVAAKATRPNAEKRRTAASEAAGFDMNEYILNMDEDSLELIEDKMGRAPGDSRLFS